MKIVKQSHEVMTPIDGISIIKHLELCGRTCYKSEAKITEVSAQKMMRGLLKSGHHSVFEHFNISVRFITDRGVTHELVRHRLCAFSQESTRYCNYGGDDIVFILPVWSKNSYVFDKTIDLEDNRCMITDNDDITWLESMAHSEIVYKKLLKYGWSPQFARSVLPNSLKTEIVTTANLREWIHILSLRAVGTTGKPHPQIQELMLPLLQEFANKIPVLFDDLYSKACEKGLYIIGGSND